MVKSCLPLFSDYEAYHGQMGPIPSSNESLDIALSNGILIGPLPDQAQARAFGDALGRPSTQQNWPPDRKLTKSCWCLHGFLGFYANVWKIILQVHTRPAVTQVEIEKMSNKNKEIGFQSAVFHLCQRASVPLLCKDRGPNASASM